MGTTGHTTVGAALRFTALLSVALYLVPTGAHLAEFAAKMRMGPEAYMTVQRIYDGWALFGVVAFIALLSTLGQATFAGRDRTDRLLAFAAFLCMAGTLAVFALVTYPVNVSSMNWTAQPAGFEQARWQWECSHAASAILTLLALLSLLCAAVRTGRG